MGSINAIRLLNSVVAGTTDSAALETALGTRRGEWQGLFAMPGQLGKMVESDTAWTTIKGSSTAMADLAASSIGFSRLPTSSRLGDLLATRASMFYAASTAAGNRNLLPYYQFSSRLSGFGITAINGVTYGNGLYVAVGASGVLTTSTDGITWTARTAGLASENLTAVTYGNGLYVIVGASGGLSTSPDGITWTARTSGFAGNAINGVTYGNGLYVIVGVIGKLSTSPDGITWTARTSGFSTTAIHGVTYGNGLYVAVGAAGVLTTSF